MAKSMHENVVIYAYEICEHSALKPHSKKITIKLNTSRLYLKGTIFLCGKIEHQHNKKNDGELMKPVVIVVMSRNLCMTKSDVKT